MRDWFKDESYYLIFITLFNLGPILGEHFGARKLIGKRRGRFVFAALMLAYVGFIIQFFYRFATLPKIHYAELITATFVYATVLYVGLSELLMYRLAAKLTAWRGAKWVKEIDYIYLLLAAAGLGLSASRLSIVDDTLSVPEYVGPFVLATALVLRATKTRAEINNWNAKP